MTDTSKNVIRISIGYFEPEKTDEVHSLLDSEFKNSLIPAIKKLSGNINYSVGIDREKFFDCWYQTIFKLIVKQRMYFICFFWLKITNRNSNYIF